MDGEEYRPTPVIMQSLPMSRSLTAHYSFDIAQQVRKTLCHHIYAEFGRQIWTGMFHYNVFHF